VQFHTGGEVKSAV